MKGRKRDGKKEDRGWCKCEAQNADAEEREPGAEKETECLVTDCREKESERAEKHRLPEGDETQKENKREGSGKMCNWKKKLTQRGDFHPKRRNSGELQKRQGEDISRNETLTRGKVEERTGEYSSGLPMLPPPNTGDPLLGEQQEGKNSQRGNWLTHCSRKRWCVSSCCYFPRATWLVNAPAIWLECHSQTISDTLMMICNLGTVDICEENENKLQIIVGMNWMNSLDILSRLSCCFDLVHWNQDRVKLRDSPEKWSIFDFDFE